MQLTNQQQACINFIKNSKGNAVIIARAGAGKTSTLIEMFKNDTYRNGKVLITYNKVIQLENLEKVAKSYGIKPSKGKDNEIFLNKELAKLRMKVTTSHSLGYYQLQQYFINTKFSLNKKKIQDLCVKWLLANLTDKDGKLYTIQDRQIHSNACKMVSLISRCKVNNKVNEEHKTRLPDGDVITADDVSNYLDELGFDIGKMGEEHIFQGVCHVLNKSNDLTFKDKQIDFDDMIYIPVLMGRPFSPYLINQNIYVDESQDLNPQQHLMLTKLKPNRLVLVGDPKQALYGFRGALEDSMAILAKQFNCTELKLNRSFRCPIAVIDEARKFVQDIETNVNVAGEVNNILLSDINFDEVDNTCAFIARANSSVLSTATKLALAKDEYGKYKYKVNFLGDVLLTKTFGRLVALTYSAKEEGEKVQVDLVGLSGLLRRKITALRKADKPRMAEIESLEDLLSILQACVDASGERFSTIGELKYLMENLLRNPQGVTFGTIHAAKGREWDTVYVLKWGENGFKRDTVAEAERLRYVAVTRAKKRLILVEDDDVEEF